MLCIWGTGDFDTVKKSLEDYLKSKGVLKGIGEYGRIIKYKMGFLKSIILVYYMSDNSFKICGSREFIDELKNYLPRIHGLRLLSGISLTGKGPSRVFDPIDKISELLIERNIYMTKYYHSISAFKASLIYSIIAVIISRMIYGFNDPLLLASIALIVYLALIIVPHTIFRERITYIPILFYKYKARINAITREIENLKPLISRDHPLHRVVELALREK